MIRPAPPIAVLLLCGCVSGSELTVLSPALPPDIAWVGLVLLDTEGSLVSATGLLPVSEPIFAYLPTTPKAARGILVGYSQADLGVLGDIGQNPSLADLRRAPLRLGQASNALPPPTWAGTGSISRGLLSVTQALGAPELTTSWAPPCPRLLPRDGAAVEIRCQFCSTAAPVQQSGCGLIITQSDSRCTEPTFRTQVQVDGTLSVEPGGEVSACRSSESPSGGLVLDCDGNFGSLRSCRLVMHTEASVPGWKVRTATVFPAALAPHSLDNDRFEQGYLAPSLALLADRLVVADFGERDGQPVTSNIDCKGQDVGRFHFFDPDALVEVATATAPPCMVTLAPDPLGGGFLGASSGSTVALVRFDPDGRQQASLRLTPGAARVTDLVLSADGQRVAVTFHGSSQGPNNTLLIIELAGLTVTASTSSAEDLYALSQLSSDAFASVYAGDRNRIEQVGWTDHSRVEVGYSAGCLHQMQIARALYHPGSKTLFGSSLGPKVPRLVGTKIPQASCADGAFFEWDADPFGLALVPARPNLVLVGVGGRRELDRRAGVAWFDPQSASFLKGATVVGGGFVAGLSADGRGRVFGLLPAAAKLFRLDP